MALQSSGQITIDDIRTELGSTSGSLRTLSAAAGKTSPDAMSEFYGYSSGINGTDHFDIIVYTGNGGQPSGPVLNFGFQASMIWVKGQSTAKSMRVHDVIRGEASTLDTTTTGAETVLSTGTRVDFDYTSTSSRITTASGGWNTNGESYVAWGWKGGGTGVSNTDGSVTSTVSANADAGFSIVEFTSSGGSGTVGHGLSEAPDVIIMKRYNTTSDWYFFTTAIDGTMDLLRFNTTAAQASNTSQSFTSTTFKDWASSGDFVAYCFHSVSGYQKFTTYTGNGSFSGPTVYLDSNGDNTGTGGFKPRWVMIKRTDATGNWVILDEERKDGSGSFNNSASNPDLISDFLRPNLTSGWTTGQYERIELLDNGFQVVNTAGYLNASGGKYLVWAIA